MTMSLFITQVVNGLQLGVLLFLLAAGLTLVFGIMNFVNLAHGSLYMLGAYFGAATFNATDSFSLAVLAAVVGALITGVALDRLVLATLYPRDHLDHVLCTFGVALVANEIVRFVWGPGGIYIRVPTALSGAVDILGWTYPAYRLVIIGLGLLLSIVLYVIIQRTRVGMLIRAGASNPQMVAALGVNVVLLNAAVFAAGAGLAGLAGIMAAPLLSVQPGMGEPILILTLVVIVTGGIGSIRGALVGAIIVGLVDSMGRAFLPMILREMFDRTTAQAAGPAIVSMLIYLLMAIVLALRPNGLLPARGR